eukprot:gene21062-25278_t
MNTATIKPLNFYGATFPRPYVSKFDSETNEKLGRTEQGKLLVNSALLGDIPATKRANAEKHLPREAVLSFEYVSAKPVDRKKPRKPMYAYAFYVQAKLQGLILKNPAEKVERHMEACNKLWGNATSDEKEPFMQQATADKERYLNERAEYQAPVHIHTVKRRKVVKANKLQRPGQIIETPKEETSAKQPKVAVMKPDQNQTALVQSKRVVTSSHTSPQHKATTSAANETEETFAERPIQTRREAKRKQAEEHPPAARFRRSRQ